MNASFKSCSFTHTGPCPAVFINLAVRSSTGAKPNRSFNVTSLTPALRSASEAIFVPSLHVLATTIPPCSGEHVISCPLCFSRATHTDRAETTAVNGAHRCRR